MTVEKKRFSEPEIVLCTVTVIFAGDEGELKEIDPAHLPNVLESLAQAKRRQFASDAEIEAAFRRFDQ